MFRTRATRTGSTPTIQECSSFPSSFANTLFGEKYLILGQIEATNLYKCINKDTGQDYVCKVVPTVNHQQYLLGYMILSGHPGINVIENVFVGPHLTYIVLAPSFGDMHSYVRNATRLNEPEAAKLFYQIASIVAHCHKNGIVLRDLKLRRFVFVDPERSQLKLETLDDAIVLENSEDDRLPVSHGCPVYASPEILQGAQASHSGRTADCWSLGVILYTMLAGQYPFHDNNPALLFSKIRKGMFDIPNGLSPLAKCVIRSLLRKNPSERLTAEELLDCKWFKLMGSPSSNYCKFHLFLNCDPSETPISVATATTSINRNAPYSTYSSTSTSPTTLCQAPFSLEDKLPTDQIVPDSGISDYSASPSFFNFQPHQFQTSNNSRSIRNLI